MKRLRSADQPTRRSKRLRGEAPEIWMPKQFPRSDSMLLNLPGEIRNKIWEMVLGNKAYHVFDTYGVDGNRTRPGIELCHGSMTDDEAYRMATCKDPDKEYDDVSTRFSARFAPSTNEKLLCRHDECCHGRATRCEVKLLLVCRQIYAEAAHIPFAKNNFIFENSPAFPEFLGILTSSQRQAIGYISIYITWSDNSDYYTEDLLYIGPGAGPTISYWNSALNPRQISELTGLRSLYLQLEECFIAPISFLKAAIDGGWAAENLLFFSRLPLGKVQVVVGSDELAANEYRPDFEEDLDKFKTLKWRQFQAESIREYLSGERKEEVETMLYMMGDEAECLQYKWCLLRKTMHNRVFRKWEEEGFKDDEENAEDPWV